MSCEDFRATLDSIMEGCVESGALDFRVDVHSDTQQEDDSFYILIQHSKMKEVLSTGIHLYARKKYIYT